MTQPDNLYLWFEDTEKYIKRRVSLEEFAGMVAELIIDRIAQELRDQAAPKKQKQAVARDSNK